jgi:putative ABC transport system permease protein
VTLVAQTLNDLYFSVSVSKVYLSPVIAAGGVALGVIATTAAALPPAIEATRAAPDSAMRRSDLEAAVHRRLRAWARLGLALVILSVIIMAIPSKSVFIGFVCLWSLVFGCAMLTPAATATLIAVLQRVPFLFREPPQKLALRSVSATLSRTSIATMALMIATATGIGIGVMIASFRGSVVDWLDTLLRADIYVADTSASDPFSAAAIDRKLLDRLRDLPGVEALSTVRRLDVGSGTERVELAVYELPRQARPGFQFKNGNSGDIWDRWDRDDVVIVSEPFAYRRDLAPGDQLELHGQEGPKAFEIVGIYYDYSSEHGVVAISRSTFERHWNDGRYNGIGVYAASFVDDDGLMAEIRRALPEYATFTVRSIAALKADSLVVFDRTFAITGVLRLLAVIVAFIGVLGALLALQLERTREFGVLRALGFSDAEIRRLVLTHTGLIGFVAGLIAIPVGIVMAAVLIFVINLRSFGWTMAVDVPLFVLVQAWSLAVISALLAGVIPAIKATRIPPAVALRYE